MSRNAWKKRTTGIHDMNQRSPEYRHHSDSALIALHKGLEKKQTKMNARVKRSVVMLVLSGCGAVFLFRVMMWLAYAMDWFCVG